MGTQDQNPGRATRPYRVYNATTLGAALRDLRAASGLTQAELADRLGVDRTYVSEMENGKETEQLARLFRMLRVLGARMTIGRQSW